MASGRRGCRLFRRIGFAAKAVIISIAFVVPLLGLLGWKLQTLTDQALQSRMDATRAARRGSPTAILVWAHGLETAGQMPRQQAQQLAMRAVAALRYDGREYFWINDMQPRMVMHPIKPELDGKDLSQSKDPNGFALFNAFVDTVRRDGHGFVAYQWPKPGSDKPVDKISYVQGFEPWGVG